MKLYHYGYSGTATEGAIVKFNTTFDSDLSVFNDEKLLMSAKDAVKQAFKVHRFTGNLADNHTFEIVFKEEEKNNG